MDEVKKLQVGEVELVDWEFDEINGEWVSKFEYKFNGKPRELELLISEKDWVKIEANQQELEAGVLESIKFQEDEDKIRVEVPGTLVSGVLKNGIGYTIYFW